MLNKNDIEKILPHRDPFLLVDEIIEVTDTKAKGIKYVNENEYYFKGHFPNEPVMPGVLIIEALAQVGGIVALSKDDLRGKIAYLTGISDAKFRKVVKPGDKLILECEITKFRRGFGFGEGKAYVDNELVCEAKISFAIR